MNKYSQSTPPVTPKSADASKSASNVSIDGKFNKSEPAKINATAATMNKDASASTATAGSKSSEPLTSGAAKPNPASPSIVNAKTDAAKHV